MIRKIGLVQMDIVFGDPESNKKRAAEMIKEASDQGCDTVVLPEMWTTGYDLSRLGDLADESAEEATDFLSSLSKKYSIHMIGGSVPTKTEKGITNTLLVTNAEGDAVKKYSKLHLFKLMDEHHYLLPGSEMGMFSLQGESMAGLICYDIRFPEWFRKHVLSGAKVVFVVAEWPAARIDHWKTLLKARAIENQCFVVACNRVGRDPNNEFGGCSLVIGPWGDIISEGSSSEELVTAEINLEEVDSVRRRIPIFDDRRPEFY
ncbi:carbon-nitrogen family hydrolase [Bacillus sp. KH172YL63]|uniref:carbon-nitrogen family hydrolase n=1 Tax=Bacillus sp. KH172YL63 TaxID=2709784 RepID=UPI0013E4A50C|nr:carbon-nitrogen family hydrolase [Bacillus sp. KH172YL63]BCB03130.1 hydrolase [Bacillus sp. KH172YL63]